MSIFDRRPRLRWAVPAAAGALILAGAAAGTVGVSADSGLAPMTAEELLTALMTTQPTALSGTVVATADLGLPDLPMGAASTVGLTSLVSGTHTMRVWLDGTDRSRVALLADAQETDVIRRGGDVWLWSSSGGTAEHYVLAEADRTKPDLPESWSDLPSTPAEAATLALRALDATTEVTTSGVARVAGRPAYELILTPRQPDTLVDRVVVAIDGETQVPLRVQVFSTVMPTPAYEVGFTSVDFTTPDSEVFAFTPPPGTQVTDHAVDAAGGPSTMPTTAPGNASEPTTVGTGWSTVMVATIPADAMTPGDGQASAADGSDALALLGTLPRTSGDWGTGRILNGTLFSAILTDDGRMAIGAVTPETLGAALAAQ